MEGDDVTRECPARGEKLRPDSKESAGRGNVARPMGKESAREENREAKNCGRSHDEDSDYLVRASCESARRRNCKMRCNR